MRDLRLAYHPQGGGTLADPTIRLAVAPIAESGGANSVEHHVNEGGLGLPEPTGQLALAGSHSQDKQMAMEDRETAPALLVSYVYLGPFLKNRHRYYYRDWVLDSGAFSAHNSGTEIKLQDYIDCCKKLLAEDQTLAEVFALDVIGDWKASLANCEEMWRQGVQAIPCYHVGEPEHVLKKLAKEYPKIALGGAVGYRGKDAWAAQCFARIWPKPVHGFGFGSEKSVMGLPWHSVDATNWEIGPCKYGRWNAYGGKMSVRGSKQNLRAEVEWYLALERRARQRWSKEMQQLQSLGRTERLAYNPGPVDAYKALAPPQVRLAVEPSAASGQRIAKSIEAPPSLSLRMATKVSGREKYLE